VADDLCGVREFTLTETLEFLRQGYTDVSGVGDPLSYARDLCLRGELLACFLKNSAELLRAGFLEAASPEVREALSACLNPQFVSPELAASLTPKDVLALHAVVYATSGPAVFDEFLRQKVASSALEGKDYAYLSRLKHYCLKAREEINRVRSLSGMYEATSEVKLAGCPAASDSGSGHKCSGACQTEGGKCSGACQSGGGEQKCAGACKGHEGGEHKCTGSCQTEGGKCAGACAQGCSGKCKTEAPGAAITLDPEKAFSKLSIP
jgi:hypothetical protein